MNKKLIIIGAGPSGLVSSILIKKEYPNMDVLIIEKNNIVGKKLKATGSGRCNIAPISNDLTSFHNYEFIKNNIETISLEKYLEELENLGIYTRKINNVGHYPISESALNVTNLLENKAKSLGVTFMLNTKVIDYSHKEKTLTLSNGDTITYDYLVFAIGGASYSSLGGEDTLSTILKNHGYKINEFKPVLTPIKVKENVHRLFGVRLPSEVTLLEGSKIIHQEKGEVQFRKDGLSGIVILNISRYIKEDSKYKIVINPLYDVSFETFTKMYQTNKDFLLSLLNKDIIDYGEARLNINLKDIKENDLGVIYNYFSNLTFTYHKLFPLEYATVSRGGVDVKNLNYDFSSKIENNVYFLGEIIDIDGPCGGYSLRYAITSAIIFSKQFNLN